MNDDNLKGKGFDSRTTSERRELAIIGGKASGEARRRKADFRKALNQLLTAKVNDPTWTEILTGMGAEATYENVINAAMIRQAAKGDVKAFEAIAKYSGQTTRTEADDEEQRIRIDRARRARDQEIGDRSSQEENIKSFLDALRPSDQEIRNLFDEEEDDAEDEEETE